MIRFTPRHSCIPQLATVEAVGKESGAVDDAELTPAKPKCFT